MLRLRRRAVHPVEPRRQASYPRGGTLDSGAVDPAGNLSLRLTGFAVEESALMNLFDSLLDELAAYWKKPRGPRSKRAFRCECERPVFFRNSRCLGCEAPLGYEPERGELRTLKPGGRDGRWRLAGKPREADEYRRCANFETAAGCNWLIPAADEATLCRACRLNRTIPNLDDADNRRYWSAIENAKRRMVSQLLALQLPVESREENPERGLAFDFLRSPAKGPRVLTGHADGLITLNVEEADDAIRERIRHDLHEPYRTLLGHFRHEIGHYYWDRLVRDTAWLEPFRELFGDERADYAAALKNNYENGPPEDWRERYISTYASTHPWEDWAETWAHYLHMVDSLDTAIAYGLDAEDLETEFESFGREDLYQPDHPDSDRALTVINSWIELVTVLNEMARSLGQPDFYPFVLSRPVVRKLHFISLVAQGAAPGGESSVRVR